jgi:hypothetical protein
VKLLFLALCLLLTGCANTVRPTVVYSSQASWDGSDQNSGIISETADHHGVVTPHFRDRYNRMIAVYGNRYDPPLRPDDGVQSTGTNTFLIDAQHFAYFFEMNKWRKSPQ